MADTLFYDSELNNEATPPEGMTDPTRSSTELGLNSLEYAYAADTYVVGSLNTGWYWFTARDTDDREEQVADRYRAGADWDPPSPSHQDPHIFAGALDAVRSGIVLVDRERRIVHANRVASAMLASGESVVAR